MQPFTFDLKWGGYYTYPTTEGYVLWRLLDLKEDVLHCMLFDEFDHQPTLDEARASQPLAMHAPIAPVNLLSAEGLVFLGSDPLTEQDLSGYATYLEARDYGPEYAQEVITDVMEFCQENPQTVVLSEHPERPGSIVFGGKVEQ